MIQVACGGGKRARWIWIDAGVAQIDHSQPQRWTGREGHRLGMHRVGDLNLSAGRGVTDLAEPHLEGPGAGQAGREEEIEAVCDGLAAAPELGRRRTIAARVQVE